VHSAAPGGCLKKYVPPNLSGRGASRRVSQNSRKKRNRSTNVPSPCPSPSGRGDRKAAADGLPLSLGEGWGEGKRRPFNPDRATISGSLRVLRQFPHAYRNNDSRTRRGVDAGVRAEQGILPVPLKSIAILESNVRLTGGRHCWLVQQCMLKKHCWTSQQWRPLPENYSIVRRKGGRSVHVQLGAISENLA